MMAKKVIIDTGPMVAFLNKSDRYHDWALQQFSQLKPPFLTCESVISEACFLLRNNEQGVQNTLSMLKRNLLQIDFDVQAEIAAVQSLMKKYSDIPMSLADACLVRMSEQLSESIVVTLDSDFKIYRKNKRNVIPIVIPGDVLR
jgi:predicted nucleic acid-binding protein